MTKSKLYIRTLSTILSVLTIFPGMYNSYGVKAVKPKDGTNAKAVKPKDRTKAGNPENETDKKPKAALPTSQSSSSQALITGSQLALATSSEEQAVATTSNSQSVVTKELCEQASEIIECHSDRLVKLWTECLVHFEKILSFCEKEDRKESLSKEEKEALSKAFEFIISNDTIVPLPEGAVAQINTPLCGVGLDVSDELVTTYESLYKICLSAKGKSSSGTFSGFSSIIGKFGRRNTEPDNNADFAQNAYKVFQKNMGKSNTDKGSIWNLTYQSRLMLSNRILLLERYGTIAIDPMTVKFQSIVNMMSGTANEVIDKLLIGVNSSIQNTGNCLASGGMEAITKPVLDKCEVALKNVATTFLDYAKITALQTGAGLAGIFVTAKLVCNLISKIGSDSNNRNKQQKQAVAENCEKSE